MSSVTSSDNPLGLTERLSQIYDDGIEPSRGYDDPRRLFAVRYSVRKPAVDMAGILKRLEGSRQAHPYP